MRIIVYHLRAYSAGANHSTRHFDIKELYQFEDDEDAIVTNRQLIEGHVERRRDYDPEKSYLILHPTHTFTMNFKG